MARLKQFNPLIPVPNPYSSFARSLKDALDRLVDFLRGVKRDGTGFSFDTDVRVGKRLLPMNVVMPQEFGAVGDGVTDDTAAILAAADVVNALASQFSETDSVGSGKGAILYFPPGIYLLTDTVHLADGVSVKGSGIATTQIRVYTSGTDGLSWDINTNEDHTGGSLEDIDFASLLTCRDLVALYHRRHFSLSNVRFHGAGRFGLRIEDSVHITGSHLYTHSCVTAGLFVGDDLGNGRYNTTVSFHGCHFQRAMDGICVDASGLAISFHGCIFESAGARTHTTALQGVGIKGRWGTFTLTNPYFENNYSWDMWFGIASGDTTPTGAAAAIAASNLTTATVVNPLLSFNSAKVAGTGGIRFENGVATLIGGSYATTTTAVSFSNTMTDVFLLAHVYPQSVSVDAPGSLSTLPGVHYTYNTVKNWGSLGGARMGVSVGGGAGVKKFLYTTATYVPGLIATGTSVNTSVNVAGASPGDVVTCSFDGGGAGMGQGIVIYGSVSNVAGDVAVTFFNARPANVTLASGTLTVSVWKLL